MKTRKYDFKNLKQTENHIRPLAKRDFLMFNSQGKTVTIVICINDKLIVHKDKLWYLSWVKQETLDEYLEFINQ